MVVCSANALSAIKPRVMYKANRGKKQVIICSNAEPIVVRQTVAVAGSKSGDIACLHGWLVTGC